MGYCSCCALVLSPEGEQKLQEKVSVSPDLNDDEKYALSALLDSPDERHESQGSVLRIWSWTKWYPDFFEVQFINEFIDELMDEDLSRHFRFFRFGEDFDDIDRDGEYYDDPFGVHINMQFNFKVPEPPAGEKRPAVEHHANGLTLLKIADVSTIHATNTDLELLESESKVDRPQTLLVVYPKHTNGIFVLVDYDKITEANLLDAGYSPQFVSIMTKAIEAGASWIEFDPDGTRADSLPLAWCE